MFLAKLVVGCVEEEACGGLWLEQLVAGFLEVQSEVQVVETSELAEACSVVRLLAWRSSWRAAGSLRLGSWLGWLSSLWTEQNERL